jgi:hypothetical protein
MLQIKVKLPHADDYSNGSDLINLTAHMAS